MASIASSIPVRSNGDDILSGWFNTIRSAMIDLEGDESIGQTSFSGLASQTGTDITDLIFDETVTRRARIEYTIVTATKVESGEYIFLFDGADWNSYAGAVEGDNSAITLDVAAGTGQAEYTSSTETFTLEYKATTFDL